MKTWKQIKSKQHDISGIINPNEYLFELIKGIYYPIEKIK